MKKKNFILVVLLLLIGMFFLSACQGEVGIEGDKGPTGETGAKGAKGETGDKGAKGAPGEKGDAGEDADDITLSTTSEGIVWKYAKGDDSSYEPVISWDDFFAYRYTYTITLDANGGKFTQEDGTETETYTMPGLIYHEEYIVEVEPTYSPYTFKGWYDENENEVSGFIKINGNITLHAEYEASIILDGVDGAEGTPRSPYLNASGEQLTNAEIIATIKDTFLTKYCAKMNYDETKTAEIKAMDRAKLYSELKFNLGQSGKLFFDADFNTTDFADEWEWLFTWILKHPGAYWVSDGTLKTRGDGGADARVAYLRDLFAGLGKGTNATYDKEIVLDGNGNYTSDVLATAFCNFLFMSADKVASCSVDKTVAFAGKLYNGASDENPTDYDPFVATDNYVSLVDLLKVTLEPEIILGVGETYKLINLNKNGYTFKGWVDADNNPVTTVDGSYNGKIITATWEPAA